MYSVRCTVYDVQCTMYSVRCTVYSVRCTMYDVRCTVYDVRCTMYGVRCTVYDVRCTMYGVRCTVYDVRCTMYDVRCTMYGVRCTVYDVRCTMYGVRWTGDFIVNTYFRSSPFLTSSPKLTNTGTPQCPDPQLTFTHASRPVYPTFYIKTPFSSSMSFCYRSRFLCFEWSVISLKHLTPV